MDTSKVKHRRDEGRYYKGTPIHAAPLVHEAAETLLRKYTTTPARILDLGGGSGAFTRRISDCGYNAELADIDPPSSLGLICYKVDLNRGFDSSLVNYRSYDGITALEVIEHLENPSAFLRMVKPLLKPGGIFMLTTPNVVDLDSRRLMLTKGELWLFRRGAVLGTGHLSVLPFWLLEEVLRKEGWKILERRFIGRKERRGWRKLVVPLINMVLLLLGARIPLEAAFAPCVAYVCTPIVEGDE